MTLCASIEVSDGILAVCDGLTSFSTTHDGGSPQEPLMDTQKWACAPPPQPWVLMQAGRGVYDSVPTAKITAGLTPMLAELWTVSSTLEPLADAVLRYFSELDDEHPGTLYLDSETGAEYHARFQGLLCGLSSAGGRETWTMQSHGEGKQPERREGRFIWIGADGAGEEAREALTDAGSQAAWYRRETEPWPAETVHKMSLAQAADFVPRALAVRASHPESHWSYWGVGGVWTALAISEDGVTRTSTHA